MSGRVWVLNSGGTATVAVQVYPLTQILAIHGGPAGLSGMCGVSGGAVNGCLAASDRMDDLDATWRDVHGKRWFMRPNIDVWNGMNTLAPLHRQLRNRHVTLRDLVCPLYVGVVDLADGVYCSILCNDLADDDQFHEAILASSAQPMIMEGRWPMVGGRTRFCVDGGVLAVLPKIPDGVELGPGDTIYALFGPPVGACREERVPTRDVRSAVEAGLRTLELLIDLVVKGDLERLRGWAERGVRVVLCAPPYSGDPFDAKPPTNAWRLDVVGRQIWAQRKLMQPDGSLVPV